MQIFRQTIEKKLDKTWQEAAPIGIFGSEEKERRRQSNSE